MDADGKGGSVADVRRVSLHTDGHTVDLTVPAAVPIAELMPSILDRVKTRGGPGVLAATPARYQLCCPGASALDSSTTLAANDIPDGTLLVLTTAPIKPPAAAFDDAAEAVSTTLADTARPWTRQGSRLTGAIAAVWLAALGAVQLVRSSSYPSVGVAVTTGCLALLAANLAHRVYREAAAGLTLGLIATGYAAVAGFLAVPDGPGPPNILLAAMATGVVAVLTVRLTGGCGARTYAAVSCSALIVALAAAATVVITGPPPVLGSLTTLVALVLLESSARLSIAWAGLSLRPPDGSPVDPGPDQLRCRVIRADGWLTSLVVGSGAAAAAGAACTVAGTHAGGSNRPAAVLFAAVTGAVLLLRTRSHGDFTRTLGLLVAGTATLSLAFVIAPAAPPRATWMVAGIALPVGGALWLGFVVPALALSPVVRRSVDLLEYLGLIAIVPLGCWTCGFYSATGGLPLT